MHDYGSPYRSPATSGQQLASSGLSTSRFAIATLAFLVLPIMGGVAGAGGFILAASMLENRNTTTEPILSYGQQAGLISLPMCAMISAVIGLGIALSIIRQYTAAIVLLLLVAVAGWALNNSFWNGQIARHGPDSSEAVLYYPPLACSGLAFSTAALIAIVAFVAKQKRVT